MMNESIMLGGRAVQGFGVGQRCAAGDPMCDVTGLWGVGQSAAASTVNRAENVVLGAATLGLLGAGAGAGLSYMETGAVQGGWAGRGAILGAVVGGVAGAIWG
jgi:hypothetical protein